MDLVSRRTFLWGTGAFAAMMARGEVPRPLARFGVVTDCHYADIAASENRDYRGVKARLQNVIAACERHQVDFVVELGDFKDNSGGAQATLSKLDEIESVFASFSGGHYHVLGNHDVDCINKTQFLSHITNTGFSTATAYYSFERGGVTFIVLDCDYASDSDADHLINGGINWATLFIPPAERTWLRSVLEAAEGPVVVFCHAPLDPVDTGHAVKNAAAVRALLEVSHRVTGVFCGHSHLNSRCSCNGINYYTLASQVESGCAYEVECYAQGVAVARQG